MIILALLAKSVKSVTRHSHQVRLLSENSAALLRWKRVKNMEDMPESRQNPVIAKLDTPEFRSIFTPELNTLTSLFKKYNYELRVAGGAVRDILMEKVPHDLDFGTTATPDQMKEMFDKEEIRMLNTKGEKHGTITARINDKENFEVTTLRIDVVTDGRHADIEFTTEWKLDANRRDLTINSMFLDFEGNVYDYFFGYEDLKNKRVAFVGDAATRICEDFLRILRYFRFYGRISDVVGNHDPATIAAITEHAHGLERVSGERIWTELNKILEGNFGVELTLKMLECGIGKYIGLPENPDVESFKFHCDKAKEKGVKLHPVTMISALLRNEQEVLNLHERLRWSGYNRELALFMVIHREEKISADPLKPYQYMVLTTSGKINNIREYVVEVLKYKGQPDLAREFQDWVLPKLPVSGLDLKNHLPHSKLTGRVLTELKKIWVNDDFKGSKEDLIKHVPEIIEKLNNK